MVKKFIVWLVKYQTILFFLQIERCVGILKTWTRLWTWTVVWTLDPGLGLWTLDLDSGFRRTWDLDPWFELKIWTLDLGPELGLWTCIVDPWIGFWIRTWTWTLNWTLDADVDFWIWILNLDSVLKLDKSPKVTLCIDNIYWWCRDKNWHAKIKILNPSPMRVQV